LARLANNAAPAVRMKARLVHIRPERDADTFESVPARVLRAGA
jgi:hypothetical protein